MYPGLGQFSTTQKLASIFVCNKCIPAIQANQYALLTRDDYPVAYVVGLI